MMIAGALIYVNVKERNGRRPESAQGLARGLGCGGLVRYD
jgi:hypothetical protein